MVVITQEAALVMPNDSEALVAAEEAELEA